MWYRGYIVVFVVEKEGMSAIYGGIRGYWIYTYLYTTSHVFREGIGGCMHYI